MPCYHPLHGFRAVGGGICFARHKSTGIPMSVPCGRCIGCRLERSRQWAVRMMHESQMHPSSSFLTLTYDDDHLPPDGGLDKSAFPRFMKRLRKKTGLKLRYFHCGEYGSENGRPHYHAAIFGLWPSDREMIRVSSGLPCYTSDLLTRTWGSGFVEFGSLTFSSAQYIAKYVTKKVTGAAADVEYERVHVLTGECIPVEPPYATMSLRPGIGESWFRRFWTDVYPSDEVISNGSPAKPPRYYDTLLERFQPEMFAQVQAKRRADIDRENQTSDRLAVREAVCRSRLSTYGKARS